MARKLSGSCGRPWTLDSVHSPSRIRRGTLKNLLQRIEALLDRISESPEDAALSEIIYAVWGSHIFWWGLDEDGARLLRRTISRYRNNDKLKASRRERFAITARALSFCDTVAVFKPPNQATPQLVAHDTVSNARPSTGCQGEEVQLTNNFTVSVTPATVPSDTHLLDPRRASSRMEAAA